MCVVHVVSIFSASAQLSLSVSAVGSRAGPQDISVVFIMGSVGPLSSPGTIVVITVAYVLFSTHVWIARAQIANQLKSWGRDYPKKITELVQRIIL
jgi:hypothetical protein